MSSPGGGFNSEGDSNDSRISSSQQTYANRAASVIKASGALARFGKVLYGSSRDSGSGGSVASPDKDKNRSLQFKAKSGIMVMGQSADSSYAAIAGRDFFQVLNVNNEVTTSYDLRGSRKQRDIDKMLAVTSLKWGYQRM